MTTLTDTSALYAYVDSADENHASAVTVFRALLDGAGMVTHNYVVVEVSALVQRRLGSRATGVLFDDVLPVVDVLFVDEDTHRAAATSYRSSLRRRTSLVDHVSFEMMRRTGLQEAFAFDNDFDREGFSVLP
ncbi:MAG: type II toxin-antitoxin system VapC family toxin [Acidimicrobiales bacterium]